MSENFLILSVHSDSTRSNKMQSLQPLVLRSLRPSSPHVHLTRSSPLLFQTCSNLLQQKGYATQPDNATAEMQKKQLRMVEKAGRMKQNMGAVSRLPYILFWTFEIWSSILLLSDCRWLLFLLSVSQAKLPWNSHGSLNYSLTANHVPPVQGRKLPANAGIKLRAKYWWFDLQNQGLSLWTWARKSSLLSVWRTKRANSFDFRENTDEENGKNC